MNLKHFYNFIKKKIVFFAILILVDNVCAKEMTWQDIVNTAKLNNPTIKKAEDSLKQVQLSYKVSKSNFFPQISASVGKTRLSSEVINPIGKTIDTIITDNYTYGISGRLSVFKGFADLTDLKIKNIDIQIETEKYRRTMSDVLYNLKKSYVNLLWTQEMVNLSKEIYDRRKKNYELIQQKYKAGREDKGSFLKVEANMVQAEYDYI
ncbi:MAG: TolC family protein, partial [Elusimicrobiota bacterium]